MARFDKSYKSQDAGCIFVANVVDCCNQILCNPPDLATEFVKHAEHVKLILPQFDVLKCIGK